MFKASEKCTCSKLSFPILFKRQIELNFIFWRPFFLSAVARVCSKDVAIFSDVRSTYLGPFYISGVLFIYLPSVLFIWRLFYLSGVCSIICRQFYLSAICSIYLPSVFFIWGPFYLSGVLSISF